MPAPITAKQVCACCGSFVSSLDEVTGWCNKCSGGQTERISRWLEENADHIEHFMLQGYSYRQAILEVNSATRPTCAICGKPIRYAKRTAVICRKSKICRRAARRYVYLYTSKGMSKSEALAVVISSERE